MYQSALVVPIDVFEQLVRHRVSVSQALMCARAASRVAVMKALALRQKASQSAGVEVYSHKYELRYAPAFKVPSPFFGHRW